MDLRGGDRAAKDTRGRQRQVAEGRAVLQRAKEPEIWV